MYLILTYLDFFSNLFFTFKIFIHFLKKLYYNTKKEKREPRMWFSLNQTNYYFLIPNLAIKFLYPSKSFLVR